MCTTSWNTQSSQYGGCLDHDFISVTYLEELRRDYYIIVTQTPKVDVDNDLASWYDQILPSITIASLAGGKYGIDKNVCDFSPLCNTEGSRI